MSSKNPASFRYFKARLLALGRPAVWIPALILALVAAFMLEYTTNPEWLTSADDDSGPDQSGLGDTLSEEDLRAAADIDNLEVLSNDFQEEAAPDNQDQADSDGANNSAQPSEPSAGERYLASRDRNNSNGSANGLSNNALPQPSTTGTLNPANPGSAARNSSTSEGSPYLFSLGLFDGASNSNATTSTSATISPLERAIRDQQFQSADGSETEALSETETADTAQPADAAAPGLALTEPTASPGVTSQSTGSSISVPFIPTSTTMSPPPGTTGYTLPPALTPVNPSVSGTNIYSPSISPISGIAPQPSLAPPVPSIGNTFNPVPNITNVGVFGPTLSQPLGASSIQATPQATPFSASRRSPGRNIGNGEINTFSNP